MSLCDKNKDGALDYEEFIGFIFDYDFASQIAF